MSAIGPVEYFFNGVGWAGFQLALIALLFKSIPPQRTAMCFSLYAAIAGLSGAVCTILGGRLALWLAPVGGFRALWLVTSIVRMSSVWALFSFLGD